MADIIFIVKHLFLSEIFYRFHYRH